MRAIAAMGRSYSSEWVTFVGCGGVAIGARKREAY